MTCAWIVTIFRASRAQSGVTVNRIHHMMTVLIVLKTLTLLFESIRFHYLALTGTSDIWSVIFYTLNAFRGIMLFVVILLIGSGWSLLRPFLNDREKRIILAVLVLQVVDNIAIVVVAETAPGSIGWLTWRDVLHLVDIVCCCAILFPIVWSIRHLRYCTSRHSPINQIFNTLSLGRPRGQTARLRITWSSCSSSGSSTSWW